MIHNLCVHCFRKVIRLINEFMGGDYVTAHGAKEIKPGKCLRHRKDLTPCLHNLIHFLTDNSAESKYLRAYADSYIPWKDRIKHPMAD